MFYSSCLMYTEAREFLPLPTNASGGSGKSTQSAVAPVDGGRCLACEAETGLAALPGVGDTPHYFLRPERDSCAPCDSPPSPPPPPLHSNPAFACPFLNCAGGQGDAACPCGRAPIGRYCITECV